MPATLSTDSDPTALLEHLPWLSKLAARLTQPAEADDAVQDTWMRTQGHPMPRSPRAWLGQALRNGVRMRARGELRRKAREAAAPLLTTESREALDPEQLLARAERLRLLLSTLETLDEPFRTTVLAHYFEGLSLAELARQSGVPAGTVRWRMKEALARLRVALDRAHGGDRSAWVAAFTPFAAARTGTVITNGAATTMGGRLLTHAFVLAGSAALAGGIAVAWTHAASESPPYELAEAVPVATALVPMRPTPSTLASPDDDEPTDEASGLARFADATERERFLARLEAARMQRLRTAGVFENERALAEAAAEGILGDIEMMMMYEGVAELAVDCGEISSMPSALQFHVLVAGEPEIGGVVEDVHADAPNAPETAGAFIECMRESLFLLQTPVPEHGGRDRFVFTVSPTGHAVTVTEVTHDLLPPDDEAAP